MPRFFSERLRARAKKIDSVVSAKRAVARLIKKYNSLYDGELGLSLLNVVKAFPSYAPSSAGTYRQKAAVTRVAIQNTLPLLAELSATSGNASRETTAQEFFETDKSPGNESELRILFDRYGSDKGGYHEYWMVYTRLIRDRRVQSLIEIGLGTTDTNIVSNMSRKGRPGASLRAFRDYLPQARIFGADIDKKILFQEERVKTFWVDQTDHASLLRLKEQLGRKVDLIIDDGLHVPHANLATFLVLQELLTENGCYVVEDIPHEALPLWRVASALLAHRFDTVLIRCKRSNLFVVYAEEVSSRSSAAEQARRT